MTQPGKKIAVLSEGIAESTTACLVVMVQGNMLAVTLGHLAIASETGIIAGVLASMVVLASRTNMRWVISVTLGVVTALVDFFVHPGQFVPPALEALATGLAAGLISFLIGTTIHHFRARP